MKNHLAKVQQALLAGRHGVNGLEGYHQNNCTTSVPSKGLFRIYRNPNLTYKIAGSTSVKNYSYTGGIQSVSLTAGSHLIECWGADGGAGGTSAGGTGGYSKGTITLSSAATYYICVGGKGTSDSNNVKGYYPGGYNGGGQSYGGNGGRGAGGGATHVASATGVLSSLSGNKSAVKIVAGGGGGGFYFSGAYAGGNGGGVTGANGKVSSSSSRGATGGTQTAAGTNSNTSYTSPGFGYGGQVPSTKTNTVAGGGAGYYGGGCGNSGAGGSGYVGGVTGGVTYQKTESGFVANPDTSGNGYVRITTITNAVENKVMYGGLRLRNTDNRFGLMKGHTYVILFNITGKSTNAPAEVGWTNNHGWGGGGLMPNPSNIEANIPSANFNQSTAFPFYYKWTIPDDIYKVCTTAYSSFVKGTTYLSYRDFIFSFGYADTGSLGTDLYISNFRLYDITNKPDFSIEKDGIINAPILYRSDETVKIAKRYDIAHLIANNFYEI